MLEADPSMICQRVALRADDIPIGEQTVAQVTPLIFATLPANYLEMEYKLNIFFPGSSDSKRTAEVEFVEIN